MPFSVMQSDMEQAASLFSRIAAGKWADLLSGCGEGLRMLSRECREYDRSVRFCKPFIAHFTKELQGFCRDCAKEADGLVPQLEAVDFAVALVEDMALFIREKALRTGFALMNAEEKALIKFFEECGLWSAKDGSTVMDTYHVTLPVAVSQELLFKMNEAVSSRVAGNRAGKAVSEKPGVASRISPLPSRSPAGNRARTCQRGRGRVFRGKIPEGA